MSVQVQPPPPGEAALPTEAHPAPAAEAHGGPARLCVESVVKEFGRPSGPALRVLDCISLGIRTGEFAAIVGPSGCGKSTLLNIIAGLEEPTSGCVAIDGRAAGNRLGRVAYMHQSDLLLPWRTVLENATLGLEVQGVSRSEAATRALELLPEFGLSGFEDALPWRLSGGMRQRVALLRATLPQRGVLLLDEPFGALDAITRAGLQDWLSGTLDRRERVVLLVTHDVEEALLLSDRVYVMSPRPGAIIAVFEVDLPRPRRYEQATAAPFVDLRRRVLDALGGGKGAPA